METFSVLKQLQVIQFFWPPHFPIRVLTIHGSADGIIPAEDATEFAKIIPNHKLEIIEGANHGYTSHQAELASVVVPFIKQGLRHAKDEYLGTFWWNIQYNSRSNEVVIFGSWQIWPADE